MDNLKQFRLIGAVLLLIVALIIAFTAEPQPEETCIIKADGSCSLTAKAPSEPGTYTYTACIDLNDNSQIEGDECVNASLEVVAE